MTPMELLELLGSVRDSYVADAQTPVQTRLSLKRPLLVAAVAALMLLLVGCAVAYASGWFADFFAFRSGEPLSLEQIEFIQEKEQIIQETQTKGEWTVELKSAIHDGRSAYAILAVTAPREINLEPELPFRYSLAESLIELIDDDQNILIESIQGGWQDDQDGLANTNHFFIRWDTVQEEAAVSPFGPEVEWTIHVEHILYEGTDEEYRQELLEGKYKGQENIMFTAEETERMWIQEVVAEGPWDFSFSFSENDSGMELLSSPITVKGYTHRYSDETEFPLEDVTITSFILHSFGAVIRHQSKAVVYIGEGYGTQAHAVMTDGSQIALNSRTGEPHELEWDSSAPIVLSEVDHILLRDGTVIPMP